MYDLVDTQGLSAVEVDDQYWEIIGQALFEVRYSFPKGRWDKLVDAMIWLTDNPNFGSRMEY